MTLATALAAVSLVEFSSCRHVAPSVVARTPSETTPHSDDELLDLVTTALPGFELQPADVYVERDAEHAEWRAFLARAKGDVFTLHPKLFEILVRGDYEVFRVRPRPRGPSTVVCAPSCVVVVDRHDPRLMLRTWR